MTTGGPSEHNIVDLAIAFMSAEPGAAQRALARHRRLRDGQCSGCIHARTQWPCFAATVALRVETAEAEATG
jgi:hypothetical protein